MILFIKAKTFQYLGVYLTQKEQDEFINNLLKNRLLDPKSRSYHRLIDVEIGMWQAHNGFTTYWGHRNPIINRVIVIYKTLKDDLTWK